MNAFSQKRIRLQREEFRELRRQVLERDGWKCQLCGSFSGVELHHLCFRSQGGKDSDENLIAVCRRCHDTIHNRRAEKP